MLYLQTLQVYGRWIIWMFYKKVVHVIQIPGDDYHCKHDVRLAMNSKYWLELSEKRNGHNIKLMLIKNTKICKTLLIRTISRITFSSAATTKKYIFQPHNKKHTVPLCKCLRWIYYNMENLLLKCKRWKFFSSSFREYANMSRSTVLLDLSKFSIH